MPSIREMKHQINLHKWAEIIKECQQSGEYVESWCESKGIGVKSYYYWLKRVRTEIIKQLPEGSVVSVEEDKPHEVILPTVIKPLQIHGPMQSEGLLEICLPFGHINIHGNVSKETISAAIEAMRQSC